MLLEGRVVEVCRSEAAQQYNHHLLAAPAGNSQDGLALIGPCMAVRWCCCSSSCVEDIAGQGCSHWRGLPLVSLIQARTKRVQRCVQPEIIEIVCK